MKLLTYAAIGAALAAALVAIGSHAEGGPPTWENAAVIIGASAWVGILFGVRSRP